jgi:hypothetical protein
VADDLEAGLFVPGGDEGRRLSAAGLEPTVRASVQSALGALAAIRDRSTFVAPQSVMSLLSSLPYDETDEVWVLSRNDHPGFWSDERRGQYLGFLRANRGSKGINQKRILVYADSDAQTVADDTDIMFELRELHAPGTLFSASSAVVADDEVLSDLRWGCTVSTRYGYAIVATPPLEDIADLNGDPSTTIPELLRRHPRYDPASGPLAAIVTADLDFVRTITEALKSLSSSTQYALAL